LEVLIPPGLDVYGTDKEHIVQADCFGVDEKDDPVETNRSPCPVHRGSMAKAGKRCRRLERPPPGDFDRNQISAKPDKGVSCIASCIRPPSRRTDSERPASIVRSRP